MTHAAADLVIIGGGIAGLWTLALARASGIEAILLEAEALGSGQTICSQGIIHGGSKYALQGKITGATNAIANMPEIWSKALSGRGPVKLSKTQQLADHQYLIPSNSIDGKVLSFFGSKSMASFSQRVKADKLPAAMQQLSIRQSCFKLYEPVLAVDSMLKDFQQQFDDYIYRYRLTADAVQISDSGVRIQLQQDQTSVTLNTKLLLNCAGEGFSQLQTLMPNQAMQLRPLHMLSVKNTRQSLPQLYGHFIGRSSKPLLTVTSHPGPDGISWYLGGNIAEQGVELSQQQQVTACKSLLSQILPALDQSHLSFQSIKIQRAEPAQTGLVRPDDAYLNISGRLMTAWPTKLALAPRLAEKVMETISTLAPALGSASAKDAGTTAEANIDLEQLPLPRPDCADYPWLDIADKQAALPRVNP